MLPGRIIRRPTQEKDQRLKTASSRWRAIYMGSLGHLKFAGVQRSPTHIQEQLQANQRSN